MSVREGSTTEADLRAIDGVREAHATALNRGDAGGLAGLFAEDGVQMPPNAPPNVGRSAIHSWLKGMLGIFSARFTLSPEEVRVSGDWAFERGTFTLTLSPTAGGPAIEDLGEYITLYERRPGGDWSMARDIWNSNQPPYRP